MDEFEDVQEIQEPSQLTIDVDGWLEADSSFEEPKSAEMVFEQNWDSNNSKYQQFTNKTLRCDQPPSWFLKICVGTWIRPIFGRFPKQGGLRYTIQSCDIPDPFSRSLRLAADLHSPAWVIPTRSWRDDD